MKKNFHTLIYILIALILGGVFFSALMIYSRPMEDLALDLSLMNQESHVATEDTFDPKGWTVYTRDGETVKELASTNRGAYRGIELGETFYYSRVMSEALDSPTMQIGTAERMFSIWLDDELIYTDCPELDNRIGYVTLPMNTTVRQEPITISLPMNYQGKTLTIAQSTPTYSETPTVQAIPASVRLYCGYAYESGIVSETFTTAIMATAVFALGLVLLWGFVCKRDLSMLCMALSAFLWMCVILEDVSFFTKYFGFEVFNISRYARLISAVALSVFLTLKAGKLKPLMWSVVGMQSATVLFSLLCHERFEHTINRGITFFLFSLPEWVALTAFVLILVLGMVFWRKENPFYRVFAPISIGVTVIGWVIVLLTDEFTAAAIPVALASGQVTRIYIQTFMMLLLTAIACAIYEVIRQELARRAQNAALENRRELMQASYENMRRQHEKVMEMRHDMMQHYTALRSKVSDDSDAAKYLDHLIGDNKKIRSIVMTGNEMLDIILNNKLGEAADAGIDIQIAKAAAPEKLPLPDTDLCSLVMNVMSNAVKAAAASGADTPLIRLDIHFKNDYFAFTCINSADMSCQPLLDEKETVREHGLGLKIINGIVEQYNGLMEIRQDDTTYEMRIAIPLFNP